MKPYFIKFAVVFFIFYSVIVCSDNTKYPLILQNKGTIHVVNYSEFKPISYGVGQGYEADLLKAIANLWHLNIKFYPENKYEGIWLIPTKTNRHVDFAIGGITPENYRQKQGALFSIITTTFKQSLLIRKENYQSGKINGYHSFKTGGMKIGVVAGTTGEKYAKLQAKEAHLSEGVLVRYPNESSLLTALLNYKIDAIARGEIGNDYQQSINNQLMTIAKKDFHEGFAIAVNPAQPKLVEVLNQAIKQVTNNGQLNYHGWLKNHNIFSERVRMIHNQVSWHLPHYH